MVPCALELDALVGRLSSISSSFGAFHPSLALIVSSSQHLYQEAIEGTIRRANEVYNEFTESQPQFNGEVFVVGDTLGGLLLYEAMTKYDVRQANCTAKLSFAEIEEPASVAGFADADITDTDHSLKCGDHEWVAGFPDCSFRMKDFKGNYSGVICGTLAFASCNGPGEVLEAF